MAVQFNPFTGNLDLVEANAYSALNLLGTVANAAALPGGATAGDVYQAEDTGIFYVWDGAAWDDLGTLVGPQGPKGDTGDTGADGVGVVAGGTTGQALIKASNTDYDTVWGTISGGAGTPGGSDTQVQYNSSGAFAGSADLTWDDTGKVLGVGGDVNLDDGGTYTTTLQTITATANRTISLPDATGTVALVAGSSGQLIYNNAGANAGVSSAIVGSGGDITLSANGAASTSYGSAFKLTGSWFVGANPVPQALIQPAGTATSTAWSTSGTGLGVNAASGFTGNLLDLQVNGASKFRVETTVFTFLGHEFRSDANALVLTNSAGTRSLITRSDFSIIPYASYLGWGDLTSFASDLRLYRDAANTLAQRNGTNAQTYHLYNTYTDASNYERAYLRWASNVLKIGTEGAGTGTARDLTIQTGGLDRVTLGGVSGLTIAGSVSQVFVDCSTYFASTTAAASRALAGNGFKVGSSYKYEFSSTSGANGTPDAALARDQAGVVAITNGSTGTGYLKQTPVAVSALPNAATVGAGTRGFVSDSTVAASGNFGATVTGGGSNNVPVFSDGTNWLIG